MSWKIPLSSEKGRKKVLLVFLLKFLKCWWVFGGHNREFQRKRWISKKGEWGKKEKATEDALKAAEIRKHSLETFTKSENRNNEEITPKRTRNNGNDTISYLTAKYESEFNLWKEELALRREEIETTKTIIQQQGQHLSVLVQNQQNQ